MSTKNEMKTLRDEFALACVAAMNPSLIGISRLGDVKGPEFCKQLAEQAYRLADACMEARKRY